MDLIAEVIQSINWIEIIKSAIVIGVWEGSKLGFKKLARMNPKIYLKIVVPLLTGTILLLFPSTIATTLSIDMWIVYVAGALLVFIVILPYLIFFTSWVRWKKSVWKKG